MKEKQSICNVLDHFTHIMFTQKSTPPNVVPKSATIQFLKNHKNPEITPISTVRSLSNIIDLMNRAISVIYLLQQQQLQYQEHHISISFIGLNHSATIFVQLVGQNALWWSKRNFFIYSTIWWILGPMPTWRGITSDQQVIAAVMKSVPLVACLTTDHL